MLSAIKSYEDLPVTLNVEDVAAVLGISCKVAYILVKRRGFPAIRVGERRIVVPRDKFLQWIEKNANEVV